MRKTKNIKRSLSSSETLGSSISGGEFSHIFINVQDDDDITKVGEYLSENLSYDYVKSYEIDVFLFP